MDSSKIIDTAFQKIVDKHREAARSPSATRSTMADCEPGKYGPSDEGNEDMDMDFDEEPAEEQRSARYEAEIAKAGAELSEFIEQPKSGDGAPPKKKAKTKAKNAVTPKARQPTSDQPKAAPKTKKQKTEQPKATPKTKPKPKPKPEPEQALDSDADTVSTISEISGPDPGGHKKRNVNLKRLERNKGRKRELKQDKKELYRQIDVIDAQKKTLERENAKLKEDMKTHTQDQAKTIEALRADHAEMVRMLKADHQRDVDGHKAKMLEWEAHVESIKKQHSKDCEELEREVSEAARGDHSLGMKELRDEQPDMFPVRYPLEKADEMDAAGAMVYISNCIEKAQAQYHADHKTRLELDAKFDIIATKYQSARRHLAAYQAAEEHWTAWSPLLYAKLAQVTQRFTQDMNKFSNGLTLTPIEQAPTPPPASGDINGPMEVDHGPVAEGE